MTTSYARDMRGYGRTAPDPQWPGGARVAVQFVINYEEGGENNILHGDAASEAFLSEIVGAAAWPGQRHWNMESIYEYGARAGFWRLWRMFTGRALPVTVYGVATALERSPEQVAAMQKAGWEIASHGLKWIEYKDFAKEDERAHMREAIHLHETMTGERPLGWYTGRCSMNTLDLVMEDGGFLYAADSYADDLPYWVGGPNGPQLVVPYTLDANDMRFATPQGFNAGDQFYAYLRDTFDQLYAEGEAGSPKMMSIGLHCRLAGRPGRALALAKFLDHVKAHEHVWVATRLDIARHWHDRHGFHGEKRPSDMDRSAFIRAFGGIFEHSPHIAERAFDAGLTRRHDSAQGLHRALCAALDASTDDEKLALLRAHPDLAGKLALAGTLTADSTAEQASAGLDALAPDELKTFTALNNDYTNKFDFPFIMAVKGCSKSQILQAFEARVKNDRDTEFAAALDQVRRITLLRLIEMLPDVRHDGGSGA